MNVYSNPEKFGMEIVAVHETGGSYEFDTLLILKNKDGELFMAEDSGCSCPIPFEDMGIDDLHPVTKDDAIAKAKEREKRLGEYRDGDHGNLQDFLIQMRKVK